MDTAKLDASIARFKARTLEIRAKRHTVMRLDEPPKPQETVNNMKKSRVVCAVGDCRCRAKTLEGKQCGFKAFAGGFCKKHVIKT